MFAWSTDKREKYYLPGRILFAFAVSLIGGALTGFCSLYFATGNYSAAMFVSYLKNPYILCLNLVPALLLSAVFYLMTNRAAWSYLLTNVCVMIPTIIHYFKMAFRGDCLVVEDFTLIGESKKMLETYTLFIDKRIGAYLIILTLYFAFCCLCARGRFRRALPRVISALALVIASAFAVPLYTSDRVYNTHTQNEDLIHVYSESQQYISKGFIYPFLHSAKAAVHPAPQDYDEDAAKEVLASYAEQAIPKEQRVNIVAVMLEAYNDFSQFDELTFVKDVYAQYHALEAMGYSGTLVTDIFAGDTRISEREFLTGLPYTRLDNFVGSANSYVWYLKQNGYYTEGAHPCYAWFYNRQSINKNLGFDNYYFSENYFAERTGSDITYDAAFFPMIYEMYEMRDKDTPYFGYHITYQGHGPYESGNAYFDTPYVNTPSLSESESNILNNYLHSIEGTTAYLYDFVTKMLATDDPLVLVFFGDHKPWLGNGNEVYNALGISLDTSTADGFLNYYSTRYLILANDSAKELCKNDFAGEGETIHVSMLMNKVFELCGYNGSAYMQFTNDMQKNAGLIHRSTALIGDALKTYDAVTYYYRRNFIYE